MLTDTLSYAESLPKRAARFIEKRLSVGCDERIFNARQYSDLVQCVFFFLVAKILDLHFFECVDLAVNYASNFINA